jgi:hypothetical protein
LSRILSENRVTLFGMRFKGFPRAMDFSRTSLWPPRWLVLALSAVAICLLIYAFWWSYAARAMQRQLEGFRVDGAAQGVTAAWDALDITGFPLRLQAKMTKPSYTNRPAALNWRGDTLSIQTLPWSISQVLFETNGQQHFNLGPMVIDGATTSAAVSLSFDGQSRLRQIDIAAMDTEAKAGAAALKAKTLAAHWRVSPDDTTPTDGRDFDAALNGQGLNLQGVELLLGPDVEKLVVNVTLQGVPQASATDPSLSIPAWRAKGSPIRVREFVFVSGGVNIEGEGHLSLTPMGVVDGQLSLTIGGVNKLLDALSAKGLIDPQAKASVGVAAGVMAMLGASVTLPLIFKDGRSTLGPVDIGPAPRLAI